MSERKIRRSSITGRTVTPEFVAANPDTTTTETVRCVPEAFWRTQIMFLENRIDWAKEQIEQRKTEIAELKRMKEFCEEQLKRTAGN